MSYSVARTSVMRQMGHAPGASDVWSGCIGQRYPISSRSSASTSSRLVGREAHETSPTDSTRTSSERSHTADITLTTITQTPDEVLIKVPKKLNYRAKRDGPGA